MPMARLRSARQPEQPPLEVPVGGRGGEHQTTHLPRMGVDEESGDLAAGGKVEDVYLLMVKPSHQPRDVLHDELWLVALWREAA